MYLNRHLSLGVEYDDSSRFGALISGQSEARLKRYFHTLVACAQKSGLQRLVESGPDLLASTLGDDCAFYQGPGQLREDFAYPQPDLVKPSALRVEQPGRPHALIPISGSMLADLASWIGEWQEGKPAPQDHRARSLWLQLSELGCFESSPRRDTPRAPVTFVGHATVLLSSPRTRLLVDPFLLPEDERFPSSYQPYTAASLVPDVVLITHSHRDHFHPGTLLRFGRDTLIIVPDVRRESVLAVDMAERLKELGFRRVQTLAWSQETVVGDFRIVALPFFGEQPTTERVLSPEVRNIGNNYLVEHGARRYAFIADAGRDHLGTVTSLASEAFAQHGPVDVLFGGYRSWSLFPAQYPLTSVPQYTLFVPKDLWNARQTIMNDSSALLDTAERWHAKYVVPYADGGAPWYWQLGLGPRLDSTRFSGDPHFDPNPTAVLHAAANRTSWGQRGIASPVRVLLARPGDSIDFDPSGEAALVTNEGHRFPYADTEAASTSPGSQQEPLGLTRKRVLLRLLARQELARRGIEITAEQVQAMSDELRRDNRLSDRGEMVQWLAAVGLSMPEYGEILTDWQSVIHLEGILADEIERNVPAQRAFASMRNMAAR